MSAEERQRKAFADELAENPDTPPGPTALNKRLGSRSTNALGWSKLRAELLKEAGFEKHHVTGRWGKHDSHQPGYTCRFCGVTVDRQFWKSS